MSSKAGPEPENYSMEEMMERLRQRSSSDQKTDTAQLVTRADGTQMMRVRQRKRRSRQKHKEKEVRDRKLRVLQLVGGVVLLVVLGLTALGMLWYFNSRPYLNKTLGRINHATGAKTEMQQFRINPLGAAAMNLKLAWPDGNVLRSFEGAGVQAPLLPNSFFLSKWQGEEINVRDAYLQLAAPVAGAPKQFAPDKAADGFTYQFERYNCDSITIDCGKERPPMLRYAKGHAVLRKHTQGAQIRVSGGQWLVADWAPLDVDRGMVEVRDNLVQIHGLSLHSGKGKATLEGEYLLDRSAKSVVQLQTDAMPGEILMGPYMAKVLDTKMTGKGSVTFPQSQTNDYSVSLAFHSAHSSTMTTLVSFPFQDILKKELQDARFTRPDFNNEAAGTMIRDRQGVRLEGLRLTVTGMLSVRGKLVTDPKGALSGELRVGLDERLLQLQSSEAIKAVFTDSQDGYAWTTLKISGDVQSPQDDLAAKIQASGHKQGERAALPSKKSSEQEFFDLIDKR